MSTFIIVVLCSVFTVGFIVPTLFWIMKFVPWGESRKMTRRPHVIGVSEINANSHRVQQSFKSVLTCPKCRSKNCVDAYGDGELLHCHECEYQW